MRSLDVGMALNALQSRVWEHEAGRWEPRLDWKSYRFLPPQVHLNPEDHDRIAVARQLNSITRAYILGLLAGMRRGQQDIDQSRHKAEALQRALEKT